MTSESDNISALLPLKPQDYMILFVLLGGELHGYRMVKEIAKQSDERIRLEAGNLYRSIRRMIKQGLLEESDRRPVADADDERRRYYRITPLGKRVVKAEAARLADLATLARARRLI